MEIPYRMAIFMQIRRTTPADLPAVAALYDEARAALRAAGVDQWQDGYPDGASARADMEKGIGFVLEDGGEVIATACLAFGREPTYDVIEQGAWQAQGEPYGFLHRIAVSPRAKGKGAAGLFFEELKRQARERGIRVLRGDTHRDNKAMQRVMEKSGLSYRGIIHIEDGTERLAYEIILP